MWMPTPCWRTPCNPPSGTQKRWPKPTTMFATRGREIGKLPLRGRKSVDQSATVYREMVYPNKMYEAYCLKVPKSGPVAQYEPVSSYEMDGL